MGNQAFVAKRSKINTESGSHSRRRSSARFSGPVDEHINQLVSIANNPLGQVTQTKPAFEEEEPIQGNFITAQLQSLPEEDDPLQGKFKTAQMQAGPEEEELLQGKFKSTQLQSLPEEEEPMQGKFKTTQLQALPEEEETFQGKAITAQLHARLNEKVLIQKHPNKTGLPDKLKTGVETMSGHSMDDVQVHYNSSKPAALHAHAYAQGTDIHLAPGQEKHLPHEAWHVVQQKQGRVRPTMQMKGGVNVNDDKGLENEADVMGEKALQTKTEESNIIATTNSFTPQIQLVLKNDEDSEKNADLTSRYHTAEDNGDACSIASKSVKDHEQAIDYYKSAKKLRKQAGKLHQDSDGGHLLAIATLDVKIQKRRELIAELTPKVATSNPKAKAENKKGPSNWFGNEPIGTGGQASWLQGNQPAWVPRKFGT